MTVPSYGAIPSAPRPQGSSVSKRRLRIVGAVALLGASALVLGALLASPAGPTSFLELQTDAKMKTGPKVSKAKEEPSKCCWSFDNLKKHSKALSHHFSTILSGGAAGDSGDTDSKCCWSCMDCVRKEHKLGDTEDGDGPTDADMAHFDAGYKEFLTFIGKTEDQVKEKTDLIEFCDTLAKPCAASVGSCVMGEVTKISENEWTVSHEACACFTDGYHDHLDFGDADKNKELAVTCPFACLDSISNLVSEKLKEVNQHGDESVRCDKTFTTLAEVEFGNDNGEIVEDDDTDEMTMLDTTDEKAVKAATALKDHLNIVRAADCSSLPAFTEDPEVLYAKRGNAEDELGNYVMEIALGDHVFTSRIVHLPENKETGALSSSGDAADTEAEDLAGSFKVMKLSPGACATGDEAVLAVTKHMVNQINAQKLSWKAEQKPHQEGLTKNRYATGFIPEPEAEIRKKTVKLDTSGFTPPVNFRTSDRLPEEAACRAYDILDQGQCGSCYAFAAASAFSARVCHKTEGKYNIVLSPQEMMDCTNGCEGGNVIQVLEVLEKDGGVVENFCDPYEEEKSTCGGFCAVGNKFSSLEGSAKYVGGPTADGVKQMQLEIMSNGPGVVAFDVYSDFGAYKEGVYSKSDGATYSGGHAVVLVGWGTTDDGVDYWLIQNSWGEHSGDEGMWKIKRGTNECNIEKWGVMAAKPETPVVCPNTECKNGGTPYKDCSCRCNGGYSGPTCEECSLTCSNGGKLLPDCGGCACPVGRTGATCETGASLSTYAACLGDTTTKISIELIHNGDVPQKSFVGVYKEGNTNALAPDAMAYVCGTTYDNTVQKGKCGSDYVKADADGKLSLKVINLEVWKPSTAGEYKAYLIQYIEPNEFGDGGGYYLALPKDGLLGEFTILAAGCTDADKTEATKKNLPTAAVDELLTHLTEEKTAEEEEMKGRLAAAQTAQDWLDSTPQVPEPTLHIIGADPEDPVVWIGVEPTEICWTLSPLENHNPKILALFEGAGDTGIWFPQSLDGAGPSEPLPADASDCKEVVVNGYIPKNKEYTLKIYFGSTGNSLVETSFYAARARVWFQSYRYNSYWMVLMIKWETDPAHAHPNDMVEVINSHGDITTWFYTSCQCTEVGDPPAAASSSGQYEVWISRPGTVLGGYKVRFYPNGKDKVAAVGWDWINWNAIGW